MLPYVHFSIVYSSQDMEAILFSINRKKGKKCILLSPQKDEEILSFVTAWTDLTGIMLSEMSQTEERKILYDFTHM